MKLFYCYSPKLRDELLNKEFRYLHWGTHNKTKKMFWVFEGTEPLNNYLELRNKGKK